MSLGRQRFSIIPAQAVTDRRLQPRDLQVLCLLGRHTDNNGWCCRSQVKMAKELACGRSTLQRALDRLYEAGYLENRPNQRHSGAAAAHDYRVLIDPKEPDCSPDLDSENGVENGVEIASPEPVEIRETPLPIDGHPCPPVGTPCPPMSGHPLPTHERAPMLTTQDKRIGGVVARAGAQEGVSRKNDPPKEPVPKPDLAERGKRVCEAMGIAFDDPHWTGDVWLITQWDAAGFDFELDVLPTIAGVCRKLSNPPGSLSYFTKPITRNWQARIGAASGGFKSGGPVRPEFQSTHDKLVEKQNAAIAAAFQEDDE